MVSAAPRRAMAAATLLASCAAASAQDVPRAGRATTIQGNPAQFFGVDSYPPEAIRAGEQGRVVAKLAVAADGHVAECVVSESSGSLALDRRTCEIALARVTFTPATDDKGTPIASSYTLPVRWLLPMGGDSAMPSGPVEITNATFPDTVVALTVTVGGDGLVERCDTVEAMPAPATDPCVQYPVGRRMSGGATRNGKPVRSRLTFRFVTQTRFDP